MALCVSSILFQYSTSRWFSVLRLLSERKKVILTCKNTRKINHPHFKSFVHQLQCDSYHQLHQQVAQNVLHTRKYKVGNKFLAIEMQDSMMDKIAWTQTVLF